MKKLLVLASLIGCVSFANAGELWWFVSESVNVKDNTGTETTTTWETAKLYASIDGNNYGGTEIDSYTTSQMGMFDLAQTDVSSYSSSTYSFYVELWNSTERIATSYTSYSEVTGKGSGANSYATLSGSIDTGVMSQPSVYQFSSFSAQVAPEPTSALLMLLGFAGLALRRKCA